MKTIRIFFLFITVMFAGQNTRAEESPWVRMQREFVEPPLAYKSRPLWFWNAVPTVEETVAQMKACKESGYAGLAILPAFDQGRMKFMSPEYLAQYKVAADTAQELGMKLCLYDEYWFPSGSAGGLMREKFPEHLCKRLDMAAVDVTAEMPGAAIAIPAGTLMGCVAMNMETFHRENITAMAEDGILHWHRPENSTAPYKIMAFVCILDGERNLMDYLEPEAVRAFISLTYAAYQKAMPEHFGTTIDAAFYDEPMLYSPGAGRAWTPRFNEYYAARHGADPVPLYPAMFMEIGEETAAARNALFGFRAALFSESYVKTIADWLAPYGMPLTGHLDQEEVVNPTGVSGDVIKFFQYQPIPGLDEVFQYGRGSCMYKLVSSAATNFDRHLVMTEVYGGIHNMPVDVLYKEAMDQAVKGVNMFVPHAVWYDADPSRVTFQPELSYRDAKYGPALPEYNRFIGRLHLLLQNPGGTAADVAILYPIESLQSTYHFNGPKSAYEGGVPTDEDNYMRIGEYLTFHLRRDFIYLHPETLRDRCEITGDVLAGEEAWLKLANKENPAAFHTLIIPSMHAIRLDTLRKIFAFYEAGGKVFFIGRLPTHAACGGDHAEVCALLEKLLGKDGIRDYYKELDTGIIFRASSQWAAGGHGPEMAFDMNPFTRWNAADKSEMPQWLEMELPDAEKISEINIQEPFNRVEAFRVLAFDAAKDDWVEIVRGREIGNDGTKTFTFPEIETAKIRVLFDKIKSDSVSISEIFIPAQALMRHQVGIWSQVTHYNDNGGEASVFSFNFKEPLKDEGNFLGETLADAGITFPANLPPGTPTGSCTYMHRQIHGRDVYYITNSTDAEVKGNVSLHGEIQNLSWWDPHTGTITPAEPISCRDGLTEVLLTLPPVHSIFLIHDGK